MPLAIMARLRDGRYDAAEVRPSAAEWPPHPARLFCALIAAAREEAEWAALQWLENAGAPHVRATDRVARVSQQGYVVTNTVKRGGGSQAWPARTNGIRFRAGVIPNDGEFALVWPHADPDESTVAVLSRLARRVPYLGRTSSSVTLRVDTAPAPMRAGWREHAPVKFGEPSTGELRVPYPGYTDRLREAYAEGRRAWEVARTRPYWVDGPEPGPLPMQGPYGELLVFGMPPGTVRPPGDWVLTVTSTLRQAVISRIGEQVPTRVCGHGADGVPHVAYLGLLDVGHEHAHARMLGVGLAVPRELDPDEYARLWGAVVEDPLRELTVRRDCPLAVRYGPFRAMPWGLAPDRWTAAYRGGSRHWVTATPMVLDRYPERRSGRTALDVVARSLVNAGYPEPVEVEFSSGALLPGALHRPRAGTFPERRPRRPLVHARVVFAEPVVGPVIAGSLRYLGLGLFVPERDSDE